MASARKTLEQVKNRFSPKAAAGYNLVFQFEITDDQPYFLEVRDSQCFLKTGIHPDASITLTLDCDTFSRLASGQLDGFQAFSAGLLHADGNMTLAPKMKELFPASCMAET